ncbi:MAG: C-terminal target protein [Flavipsychrobacter sp.]|jgi:hypothetical protein|nr:C-terminal target protein [Flavipsychrobacter sp.]
MKRNLLGILFLTALVCGFQNSVFAAVPTISPGSIPTVCAGTYSTLPYSSTGSPTTYNITWTGSPVGLPDVPPGTILPLTSIPIIVNSNALTGTYNGTIVVSNVSGSSAPMAISITVNGLPTVETITGGGPYCVGTSGVNVGLSGSDGGVIYQLNRGGVAIGSSLWGTGAALDFGVFTTIGTYTITARNAVTLCSVNMSGSTTISTLPSPAVVSVTGGGNYCVGGVGLPIGITGSTFGTQYQLYRAGVMVGSPIHGLGMAIDFGPHTTTGIYTVVAEDTASGCTANMTGSASINVIPAPTAFSVTGGGNYCAGSHGVHIGLGGSNVGIAYKLFHAGTYIGSMPGTGAPLDFGLYTPAGVYTVVAQNSVYGCTANMDDTAYISLMAVVIPDVTITNDAAPGNAVCEGHTTMFTANPVYPGPNPTYTWTVNGAFAGTGATFSYVAANSDYVEVTMTSDATCAVPSILDEGLFMVVKAAIVPTVVVNAYPGTTIINGTYDTITAIPVNGGVNPTFQWYVNGVLVAGATSNKFISNAFKNNDTVEARVMGCAATPGSGYVVMRVFPRAGIMETGNSGRISVAPNPSNGTFTINGAIGTGSQDVNLKVLDVTGRLVYATAIPANNGQINTTIQIPATVSKGLYILNLVSETENIINQIVIE